MNICIWYEDEDSEMCGKPVEGRTDYCASHNHHIRKVEREGQKATKKRESTIEKALLKSKEGKKPISRNPSDWSNTFLCSDGTKVTQAEINAKRSDAYVKYDNLYESDKCEGCGKRATNHAHIIPQARCKVIGKTQLIWSLMNFFKSCNACNLALENPKGKDWKGLKNLEHCLVFIKGHDPELFTKFENAAIDQTKPVI